MQELYDKICELNKYYNKDIFEFYIINSNSFCHEESIEDSNSNHNIINYNIILPYNNCILIRKIEGNNKFYHLNKNNSADIFLISKIDIDSYKLDILEIKSSISITELERLSDQLIYGYLRVMTLISPLHLNINKIELYVAFYEDNNIYTNLDYLSNSKRKLAMMNIPCWKQNKIYLAKTIPNNFFNSKEINIIKLRYDNYTLNNNRAIINI